MTVEVPDTDLLLLLLVLLLVLGNGLRWGHPHLCRLEGLQSIPHGPLENLLHLFFILVDVIVAATVPVPVLQARGKKQTVFTFILMKSGGELEQYVLTCFLLLYRCCCSRWWVLTSSVSLTPFMPCSWISRLTDGTGSLLQGKVYCCHATAQTVCRIEKD